MDSSVEWKVAPENDPWNDFPGDQEYFLLLDAYGALIGKPLRSESQYFRKIIASALGRSDEWDYREWPQYETVLRTVQLFEADG